jgi:hypothetical protein
MSSAEDVLQAVTSLVILAIGLGVLANVANPGSVSVDQIAGLIELLVYVFVGILFVSVIISALE